MRFHYLIEKSLNIDHYCFISCIIKSLMSLLLKLYYSKSLFLESISLKGFKHSRIDLTKLSNYNY